MPKSVSQRKSASQRKRRSKSRNRRGNYPQNGAQPIVTHPYKLWVNDNTYPEAAVELKQSPMEANATHIPQGGIDIYSLKRKGREIKLNKGWPISLRDGSTVYILFEHSTYALPYIYNFEYGYLRDPKLDDVLNSKAEKDNPLTWYSGNKKFSNIQVYSMETSRDRSSSHGRSSSHSRNYTSRNTRRYTE